MDNRLHLTFKEAIKDEVWAQAMDEEIKCIYKNKAWDLVDVPKDKAVMSVKWIYKTGSKMEMEMCKSIRKY